MTDLETMKNRKGKIFFSFLLFALFALQANYLHAKTNQAITVSGVVVDEYDEPLIGVSVSEKATTNGTITDLNGRFSLKVNGGNSVLLFSYVGYMEQEVPVGNNLEVKITLQEKVGILDEVVVIGYGTKRKGGISAAVSTVGSEDIARSKATTTSGAIVGKLAGITARQKTGSPGSTTNIQIRNMGEPLYVIDGIMTDAGSFNNLDINDIDNISVLKDGSAAIYGVKAANGVILVTTKGGKASTKPTVSVNTYLGWQQWTTYPELMNAYEYKHAQNMQLINRGRLNAAQIAEGKAELEKWKAGTYDPANGLDYRSFDWKDNYVDNAAPQSYFNASVSGGSEKTQYYLSVSHIDQDAVFKDFNFNRTNVQANFTMALSDNFKVGYQMSGKIEDNSGPSVFRIDDAQGDYQLIRNSLFALLPTYRPFANDNPLYLNELKAHDARNMAAFDKEHAGSFESTWRTIRNNINMEYKTPLKGLTASGMFSYFYATNSSDRDEKDWIEYTYHPETDEYEEKWNREKQGAIKLQRSREMTYDITGQMLLVYDNNFGKHNVSATGGFEFYKRNHNYISVLQAPRDNPYIGLITTSEHNEVNENRLITSTASFVFRTGYNYDQRYIIDFSGRYDGSWKFPKGKRWGFFPSVSGAWRVSEENFFRESNLSNILSNLKLRVSYGEMGDDNLGTIYDNFAYLPGYQYQKGSANIPTDPFLGSGGNKQVIGTGTKSIPITGLSWMTTSILDIGMDMGFLNNKLTAEIDLFKRKREGIAARPDDIIFPSESGIQALPQNMNSDMNIGVDGFVKWKDKIGDVNYSVGANATLARQKYGKRYGERFFNAIDQYWWATSDRWSSAVNGRVWMYDVIGRFKSQEEIDNYPVNMDGQNNRTLLPGDLIFRDYNNDGVINDFDRRPLGYAGGDYPWELTGGQGNKNPLLSVGLSLGLEWKGIDFNADFAGGFMNTFCPDWFTIWGTGANYTANGFKYNSLDVWRHEDIFDPTSPWVAGKFPALRGDESPSTWYVNNFYNKNVKYMRLRNLVVGYTLPTAWTQKAYIKKLRFYFDGTNLFSFDNMKDYGIDPEVSGVQGADYPQHRLYTIGLNLTF